MEEIRRIYFILLVALTFMVGNIYVECRVYPPDNLIDDGCHVIDRRGLSGNKRYRRNAPVATTADTPLETKKDYSSIKSSFIFDGDSNNVAFVFWKHADTSVVFILTCQDANTTSYNKLSNKGCKSKSNFYRSMDYGRTYNSSEDMINEHLHSIYLSPVNKNFIILTDYKNKGIFITKNEGINYKKYTVSFSPTFILFHPTQEKYIAAYDNTPAGENALYVSENGGLSWVQVSTRVRNYFWAQEGHDAETTLLHIEKAFGKSKSEGIANSILVISRPPYTPNMAHQVFQLELVPYSLYVGNEFIIVQSSSDRKLYVLRGREGEFKDMKYDKQSKDHHHQVIIDDDNNEILLGIIHNDSTATLYLSDQSGQNLIFLETGISMLPMKEPGLVPKMDFYRAKGVIGTYIINKANVGTRITFDKGHTWGPLQYERTKNCSSSCNDELTLYIKIDNNKYDFTAPMISKTSAPGIIIAQGSIEKPARFNSHQVYISIDGGHTWKKRLSSSYGFAILDHGGLLAATPLQFTVDHYVHYSTDYGKSWENISLTKHYSRVAAIITESTAKILLLNVFGFLQTQHYDSKVRGNMWIVWSFNFTKVLTRACNDSDCTTWKHHGNECKMGERISFKRRIEQTRCYLGPKFDNGLKEDACNCTYADFECHPEYNRVNNISPSSPYTCKPINKERKPRLTECTEGGKYWKSKGYRKLFGNKCSKGVEISIGPKEVNCPLVAPVLLKIEASSNFEGAYQRIKFSMQQTEGYYETTYTWNFGDGSKLIKGVYKDVNVVFHQFFRQGHYNVTLVAKNGAGKSTAYTEIIIIEEVHRQAYIAYHEPVLINTKVTFTLETRQADHSSVKVREPPQTQYAWSIGEDYEATRMASHPYTFKKPGAYRVGVQIMNAVSVRSLSRMVTVFYHAVTVNVSFSSILDHYNTKTVTWLLDFAYKFKTFLAIKYDFLDSSRITVIGEPKTPTKVQVIFTDTDKTFNSVDNAQNRADKVTKDINENKPLLHGYAIYDVHITKAELDDRRNVGGLKDTKKKNKHSKAAWIYVFLVFIILLLVAISLGYYQYRRRGKLMFWRKHDIMKNKLVPDADDDCVGMDGPNLELNERL